MQIRSLRPHDPRALGDYEMLGVLGEGGMGAVYLAQDRLGRQVAVKVIKPEYAAQAEFRGRFRSEVNRARQVPSFCTAAVLDADPDHRTPYLVVEYVDGPDLKAVVTGQGPLSGGALHSVAVGVATALVAIHGAGVIHRDLKPPNVLFALGSPKVIDFGIARAVESTSEHTRPDQMVGTLSYMAPERLDGAAVTPAVDVFAWGVLVAYAATGRTPFAADNATATAVRILTGEPDLDGLTGALRDLVERALAKNPGDRPSAQGLLDELLAVGPGAAPPTRRRRLPRLRWVVVTASLAALVIGAGLGLRTGRGDDDPRAVTTSVPPSPAGVAVVDPLTGPGKWREKVTATYSCELDEDGLAITSEQVEDVSCPGPATSLAGDMSVKVNFQDLTEDACALVWFRLRKAAGYQLITCKDTISVALYRRSGSSSTLAYTDLRLDLAARHQLRIDVVDDIATCRLDGTKILTAVVDDPETARGAIALGLNQTQQGETGSVRFSTVEAHSR